MSRKITPVPVQNKVLNNMDLASVEYVRFFEDIRKALLFMYDRLEDIDTEIADIKDRITAVENNYTLLEARVAQNETNIATNATNIATNTTNIGLNTTKINTNITDINKRVKIAGDTMIGSLTINGDITVQGGSVFQAIIVNQQLSALNTVNVTGRLTANEAVYFSALPYFGSGTPNMFVDNSQSGRLYYVP